MEISAIKGIANDNLFNQSTLQYNSTTVKITTKVGHDFQAETIYTYDKHGRLESTVVHNRQITEI